MCPSWLGVTSWFNVCGSGFFWRPAGWVSVLPGRAMKFWLIPYALQNVRVGPLSHVCSLICFSQSFSMECFHAVWIESSSRWRRTNSSALSSRNVVSTLGCLWGRGAQRVSTVWLWAWLIAFMAMLVASWSSLGKCCEQLAVERLWF